VKVPKINIHMPTVAGIIIILLLMIIPTGFEDKQSIHSGTERVTARVISTNEDTVRTSGLIQFGEQICEVEILQGSFKGETVHAVNMLQGSLERDKIFTPGDKALVVVSSSEGRVLSVLMTDHYRFDYQIILVSAFVLLLVLFAGKIGVRAVLSFILTVLAIWKVLVPSLLHGANPIFIGLAITTTIAVITISLVYGFDRRALAASSGALLGIVTTCVMGILFTGWFKIHGAVMDYSQPLLFSGYSHLDLTEIFKASIIIGASGAMTDIAVGITSAVNEVVEEVPGIGWKAASKSGLNVGRAAMGTMTTTLLLAYSGGYIMLLMTFMAQGTPILNILNLKSVSAHILDTLVGSIGLVAVAPFTALTSGFLLTHGSANL